MPKNKKKGSRSVKDASIKAPSTREAGKNSRKGKRYTEEEKVVILFWWVYCDENAYRTSEIVSRKLLRKVSPKVVIQMANRENFRTRAPFIKAAVEQFKHGEEVNEDDVAFAKMGSNMMEIDWLLVKDAKEYLTTKKEGTRFRSVKEVIDAMRFVEGNVVALFGDANIRKNAWSYTQETEGGRLAASAEEILENLNKSEEQEIVNVVEEKIIRGEI